MRVLCAVLALAAANSAKAEPEAMNKTNSSLDRPGAGDEEDEVPGWSVPVGIVMGLSASVGINVGNNIQAMALAQMQENQLEKKPRIFWVGTAIFAIASILNFVAFGFAPAAVLAPLESVQFVSNLMFARFVNKENVSIRMCVGSGLVITGTIVAIMVGPSSVAKLSIPDLKALWIEPAWIGYLVAVAAAFTLCMLVHVHYQRQLDAGRKLRGYRVVLPFTFALSSAFVGSQAVVHAKTMSELVELVFTIGPLGLLSSWFFYFACVLLFATMGMWLYRLNAALGKYDPLFIIPLLQANYILFSTVTGGIYFQEFMELTPVSSVMFGLGVAIMFVGLYLLAPVTSFEDDRPDGDRASLRDEGGQEGTSTTADADSVAVDVEKPIGGDGMAEASTIGALRRISLDPDQNRRISAVLKMEWPLTPQRDRAATNNSTAGAGMPREFVPGLSAAAGDGASRDRATTLTQETAAAFARRRTRTASTATPHSTGTPAPAWPVSGGIEIARLSISALPRLSRTASVSVSAAPPIAGHTAQHELAAVPSSAVSSSSGSAATATAVATATADAAPRGLSEVDEDSRSRCASSGARSVSSDTTKPRIDSDNQSISGAI